MGFNYRLIMGLGKSQKMIFVAQNKVSQAGFDWKKGTSNQENFENSQKMVKFGLLKTVKGPAKVMEFRKLNKFMNTLWQKTFSSSYLLYNSGARDRRAAKRSPYSQTKLLFSSSSWLAARLAGPCIRTTNDQRWTTSLNMATILQKQVKLLCSIYSRQNKVSADQYHMTISWAPVQYSSRSHSWIWGVMTGF